VNTAPELLEARSRHEPPLWSPRIRHYLRDLVYGANDGVITTFAVVSGVAGAALAPRTVLILGMANLLAVGAAAAVVSYAVGWLLARYI
jgi:vacuolar iron transporter family protein